MFGCIVAGRLPQANPQQVDETHALFQLEQAQDINHVTVFMTGQAPFPEGYAATVHFLWPGEGKEWQLLGCLRNTKPSAIFRLRGHAVPSSSASSAGTSSGFGALSATSAPTSVTAALGISIEPDTVVDAQISALRATPEQAMMIEGPAAASASANSMAGPATQDPQSRANFALELAPKIAKNAFAYLSSFAPDSAPQTVPLLQKWLEQLERKIKMNGTGFLDKQDA